MRNRISSIIAVVLFLLHLPVIGKAQIELPAFFSDGMVLQQQVKGTLWGKAEAGSEITVTTSWDEDVRQTKADLSGNWKAFVQTPSAGGPYTISVSDGNSIVSINDVLIGEVWLCSGQSNMEMPMKGYKSQPIANSAMDILKSDNTQIRLFTVKRNSTIDIQDNVIGKWAHAEPASVKEFSATAYYYGQLLQEMLQVPVGLICSSWGGSWIESWMDSESLKSFPNVELPQIPEDIKEKNRTPTTLYNAMIAPLVGYPMRGIIWYQGESNYDRFKASYLDLFESMVQSWRTKWEQGSFPFYYCQIAPYDYTLVTAEGKEVINSAYLREAQLKAESRIENSGMAVLMDAGDEKGIHPSDKKIVGERLAFHALKKTYGFESIIADSPVYKEMIIEGNTAILSFDRAEMWLTAPNGSLVNFEIAGSDRKFYKAEAWINRSKVHVKSEKVKEPVAVRYGFNNFVKGDLFGTEGLPVSSFRTDNW